MENHICRLFGGIERANNAFRVNFIVVHNYKDIDDSNEFNRMVQRYVIESFPGELRSREVSGGFAPYYASGDINHVFLAKDYSEPGKKYNMLTYQLIRTWLATPTNIDRINSISNFITQNLYLSMSSRINNLKGLDIIFQEKTCDDIEDDVTDTTSDLASSMEKPKSRINDLGQFGEFVLKCSIVCRDTL